MQKKFIIDKNQAVKVIFRKYHTGDIVAIFPEMPATLHPDSMVCYQTIGQHGSVSSTIFISDYTSKASPSEYSSLKAELESIGYKLDICQRMSQKMIQKRLETLKAYTDLK